MQELLKKIEASAAARLTLPPGQPPAQELARYKAFLKVETHRLKLLHRAGGGGREICHARAAILDALLRHLWEAAKASLSEQAARSFPSWRWWPSAVMAGRSSTRTATLTSCSCTTGRSPAAPARCRICRASLMASSIRCGTSA